MVLIMVMRMLMAVVIMMIAVLMMVMMAMVAVIMMVTGDNGVVDDDGAGNDVYTGDGDDCYGGHDV